MYSGRLSSVRLCRRTYQLRLPLRHARRTKRNHRASLSRNHTMQQVGMLPCRPLRQVSSLRLMALGS